jgi:hypothetical protein
VMGALFGLWPFVAKRSHASIRTSLERALLGFSVHN